MVKRDISKINIENADEICSSIRDESSEEERILLGKAEKEKERILSEAAGEAKRQADAISSAAQKEIELIKEKIFSTVAMEKKRVSLEGKSLFASDVITAVNREAEKFRAGKDYTRFIRGAILEGIGVVDDEKAQVFYSHLDEAVISSIKDIPAEFKSSDFNEIGVIVQSRDGRLLFDNRFSARLKRAYDEIYIKLIKEAF